LFAGTVKPGAARGGVAAAVRALSDGHDRGGQSADTAESCIALKLRATEPLRMSEDDGGRKNLRMPDDDEVFAVVTEMLGANRVKVRCMDGKERTARIPGRMQKRIWIREDDVVLVEPWDWQDEKGDITWRYDKQDADQLREEGHISA
jgi:translation initiation factor 1A